MLLGNAQVIVKNAMNNAKCTSAGSLKVVFNRYERKYRYRPGQKLWNFLQTVFCLIGAFIVLPLFAMSCSVSAEKQNNVSPISKEKSVLKISSHTLFGELKQNKIIKPMRISPLPNGSVILLIFDALNAGHLSAYGYERQTSPFMEEFSKGGLTLTNHVSNSTWTRPSFATIITGLPKRVHGVEAAGGWHLRSEIVTLAERFKRAGYRTAGFSGNPLVRKSWGFDQGFEVYEEPRTRGIKAFPRDSVWVNAAIKWLNDIPSNEPFFLMMFLTSAHPPYKPPLHPRTFLSSVPDGEIIEHPFREYKTPLHKDDDLRIEAAYDDEIAYMDEEVRILMDTLGEMGRLDKTVVAMTADHGEMMGEHNCYLHAYHMWDQNTRVPFIISAPNLPLQNAMDNRPYTHIDIAPTLLDLVAIPYDKRLAGWSLVKTLAAPKKYQNRVRYTQVDAHGVSRQMVRSGTWKLIHHDTVQESTEEQLDILHPSIEQPNPRDLPSLAWSGERFELYDLSADPGENINLYGLKSARKKQKELKEVLKKLRTNKRGTVNKKEIAPELLEALRNAGYIR